MAQSLVAAAVSAGVMALFGDVRWSLEGWNGSVGAADHVALIHAVTQATTVRATGARHAREPGERDDSAAHRARWIRRSHGAGSRRSITLSEPPPHPIGAARVGEGCVAWRRPPRWGAPCWLAELVDDPGRLQDRAERMQVALATHDALRNTEPAAVGLALEAAAAVGPRGRRAPPPR